jgi:hypothetical protein
VSRITSTRTIGLAVLATALLAGCGGSSQKLGDGRWYGKLVSVDVADRRLDFEPACRASASDRWVPGGDERRFTVGLAAHPDLGIYFRPGGNVEEGHGQPADMHLLASTVAAGPDADSPPGWFVTVRGGAVVGVEEDSGLRSSGKEDIRNNACVWSRRTQAFVK